MLKNHQWAMTAGLAMVLCGLLWLGSTGIPLGIMFAREPVFVIQNLSTAIAGGFVLIAGRLAERRPRNAGFAVIIGSLAVTISGLTSLPFQEFRIGLPSVIIGLAGFAAGLRCMSVTRAGDR